MDYIHGNPINGKWSLAADVLSYPHSSALFYETGKFIHFKPVHFGDVGLDTKRVREDTKSRAELDLHVPSET